MLDLADLAGSWPAQQLAEFLCAVSVHPAPAQATTRGIERMAEMLEAEIVAVVRAGCESISIGFPAGQVPESYLRELADTTVQRAELPRIGRCAVAREPLDQERFEWLVVARTGAPLNPEECDLLRGAARVLGLTREMLGHRRLLECVSEIQRQIVRRVPQEEVLEAIARRAAELTTSEIAVLRRVDSAELGRTTIEASVGFDEGTLAAMKSRPETGISAQARRENRLVVEEGYQSATVTNPVAQANQVHAAMAAPVYEGETVVGSLTVASRGVGRLYSAAERHALETFAQHASVALTDARLVAEAVHLAMHDALTGLPNRALFTDRLQQALRRAERSGGQVAVLFLDVDRFKTVNDSLGHTAGDELLIAAGRRLERCIRPGDTAARFGGDEFAVLVEEADEAYGRLVAQRILRGFEQPFKVAEREVQLSASIGIAIAQHPDDDPLRDGDLAMYRAKAEGRGRASLFRPAMRAAARERLELETELRGAGQRGEMFLEYQPIVDLATQETRTVEALVRWWHPRRGRLAPGAFLPLAEETHEITTLGRWVIRAACQQARGWQELLGWSGPAVSVNLSPTQLHATDVVTDVRMALEDTGLPASALVIEVSETVIMVDVASALDRLNGLHRLGVSVAIDNFGTGHCSLQYLKRFPIEFLKIARPFVADIADPGADLSLMRAIVDLGGSCGLRVIAEGVEHRDQWAHLLNVGCELGQGYLFSPPQDAQRLEARLLSGR